MCLGPRLAAVFRPVPGQFLRISATRAFRKLPFLEIGTHMNVTFPDESPIQGIAQDDFREFMTRVIGNSHLQNHHGQPKDAVTDVWLETLR